MKNEENLEVNNSSLTSDEDSALVLPRFTLGISDKRQKTATFYAAVFHCLISQSASDCSSALPQFDGFSM